MVSIYVRFACVTTNIAAVLSCILKQIAEHECGNGSHVHSRVPAIHFFTGFHADYHRPTDIVARINIAGMSAVADLVQRLLSELDAKP
jgi:hypothetical protein